MSLIEKLNSLRPQFITAAQAVYDMWWQDEDGLDECGCPGGICDEIEHEFSDILAHHGIDCTSGGQPGDDHAFVIAYNENMAFVVDIPCHIYETGGGYVWKKKPDVVFVETDVLIYLTAMPDHDE